MVIKLRLNVGKTKCAVGLRHLTISYDEYAPLKLEAQKFPVAYQIAQFAYSFLVFVRGTSIVFVTPVRSYQVVHVQVPHGIR